MTIAKKKKDVRFLTVRSLTQHLRCRPSWGVAVMRSAQYGVQIFGNHGEPEIRDARFPRVVHKDIRLAKY